MSFGGVLTTVGGLTASEENVIQWRGAVDPRTGFFVAEGAKGAVIVQDGEGNSIASVPVVFRRPGWYEATIPETVDLTPDESYTIDFKLSATSGTVGHIYCRLKALAPDADTHRGFLMPHDTDRVLGN